MKQACVLLDCVIIHNIKIFYGILSKVHGIKHATLTARITRKPYDDIEKRFSWNHSET